MTETGTDNILISYAPATGEELWRGGHGDVAEAVSRARRAWPEWAARPLANRIEMMRRFANQVRKDADQLAELIAHETGKPLWEAKTEVEAVINKVEISVQAYAERTGKKKLDSALNGSAAVRHKPHGVMAVLG
ncbi:MAG: aldehyde dehydrogenase family protein, partial [Pseudomonadota bacterium]